MVPEVCKQRRMYTFLLFNTFIKCKYLDNVTRIRKYKKCRIVTSITTEVWILSSKNIHKTIHETEK